MVGQMMWFRRDPKPVPEKENGVVGKLRRKKVLLKPTRESSERETSTESDKERRRFSDILDIKVSQERRDESDESLYESADCHSDAISASDDALPRLCRTPTISKESLKLAVTDEEVDAAKPTKKKGHKKALSISNPLEAVKTFGDEWIEHTKKEFYADKIKSIENLHSEEDKESVHDSNKKFNQSRKNSKKDDKNQTNSRKTSATEQPKSRKTSKGSSVGALSFLRRKKTPTSFKTVEAVAEVVDKLLSTDEILNYTKFFLEEEKRHASQDETDKCKAAESSDDDMPSNKLIGEHRRRLSRQVSRSKSKARGKSQSLKVNTLRKSHSGTLKKGKKKGTKTPLAGRSRQSSIVGIVDPLPLKNRDEIMESLKRNSWLFKGEAKREGSTEEPPAPEADADAADTAPATTEREHTLGPSQAARAVGRAESCRERDAPRRANKHRNASDPNRLTAQRNHDLEPGQANAPSGSSSSSSLSSRSNESNTGAADHQASQSELSEEDEGLAPVWADSLPPQVLDTLALSPNLRKRQEVIHELIVSEGSHVRWLKVLASHFLRPLESQPTLLPPDDLKALFPNLGGVRERHGRLYSELRQVRGEAPSCVVPLGPLATALLNTLGEPGYSLCLSRFCRGQRMALDNLRERRRKNKELHQFLCHREQMPLCGRLQLRDLLACVWQRLTKYQLLLESIMKTINEAEAEAEEDIAKVKRALEVAKEVLHSVDTAIRTAENLHRLKTIQSKMEVRANGTEWEELRRIDLTSKTLRHEGELVVRNDSNKKITVLGLLFSDCLVLLQREGERFLLKPIPQPSHQALLSPLIRWDKVLFRPNAAVKNTFFLMNFNGVQMHELSANTPAEYSMWAKLIQECPLAKLTELKPITPLHQPSRSTDDSGINVSRNPSDASGKSTSTAADDEPLFDVVSERSASVERHSADRERTSVEGDKRSVEREEEKSSVERDDGKSGEKEDVVEREPRQLKPRRPTQGRICVQDEVSAPALLPPAAVTSAGAPDVATAGVVTSVQERLRRLDEEISAGLQAKTQLVAQLLNIPAENYSHMAELAVADTLGQVDICSSLRATRLDRSASSSYDEREMLDMHHILLAATHQANQLTSALNSALAVNEGAIVAARARRPPAAGRCDTCAHHADPSADRDPANESTTSDTSEVYEEIKDVSYDMLKELGRVEPPVEDVVESSSTSASGLASRLLPFTAGIQQALGAMLAEWGRVERSNAALRAELARYRDRCDALQRPHNQEYGATEEISFPKENVDQNIKDQPSNGG